MADLLAEVGGVANLMLNSGVPKSVHSQVVASDTAMLEKAVKSIGHLAGMDGAIVMDYMCNVTAFNAIIAKASTKANTPLRLVDQDGNELVESEVVGNRGSRHQSALAYIRRVVDSFAFVISQDGAVSAFHNNGDGAVLCEHGLRL